MKTKSVVLPALSVLLMFISLLPAIGSERKSGSVELSRNADYFEALGVIRVNPVPAPDFTVESLDGSNTRLSDFRGKVVFLNFWATWCGPCRAEVKDIDGLNKSLKDEEFTVMAVDIREDKGKIRSFMDKLKVDFPVYIDSTGAVATSYGVRGIPTTFIIDPDGNVVGSALGPRDWDSRDSVELMRSLMK